MTSPSEDPSPDEDGALDSLAAQLRAEDPDLAASLAAFGQNQGALSGLPALRVLLMVLAVACLLSPVPELGLVLMVPTMFAFVSAFRSSRPSGPAGS